MTDKAIALVVGLLAGMLVCCCSTAALIAMGSPGQSSPSPVETETLPEQVPIEVRVGEQYLNRMALKQAAVSSSPAVLQDVRLDVVPGNQIRFTAQVQSPLGPLNVNGTVALAVRDGKLEIRIPDVRLGPLPAEGLMRNLMPDLESQISAQINEQLAERTRLAKVKVLGVSSDESQLTFYLAGQQ